MHVRLATHSRARSDPHHRLLKLPELMARTALSRSEVYRRVRDDPTFPQPAKLGARSVAWMEAEVDAFVLSQIARRDAMAKAT